MRRLFSFLILLFIGTPAFSQCQDINAIITSTTPAIHPVDSVIKICAGASVSFTGTATFEVSDAEATYTWKFGDGTTASGLSASHTYPVGGVYVVDFEVVDAVGCKSKNCGTRLVIQVSTEPIFAGTSGPEEMCLNDVATLKGVATPVPAIFECAPPVSDTTFLPDGSGVSYETSIEVQCFTPCDTISDADQIESICMNIEHSYLGDLDAKIICPNGQDANLFNTFGYTPPAGFPSAADRHLGEPNDFGCGTATDMDPGIGYDYCFSGTASWGAFIDELDNLDATALGCPAIGPGAMLAGDYQPEESYSSLIGCPLNGTWTIKVTDHLLSDNGYIFEWGINFNDDFLSDDYSFTPVFETKTWSGPGMVAPIGDDALIKPTVGGLNCYTFSVTDDFNCTYDTVICVNVIDPGNPGRDSTSFACENAGSINLFYRLGGTPEPGGTWTGDAGVTATGIFNAEAAGAGTYHFTYTKTLDQCDTSADVTITVDSAVIVDFTFELNKGCISDTVIFSNLSEAEKYRWNFGDGTPYDTINNSPTHIYENQGTYGIWLVAINAAACRDSVYKEVNTSHPLSAVFIQSTDSVCQEGENFITFSDASVGNIKSWNWNFGDGNTSTAQNPTNVFTLAGTHTVRLVVTDDIPCSDTTYSTVYIDSIPHLELVADKDSICNGDRINFSIDYLYTTKGLTWDFGDGTRLENLAPKNYHSFEEPGNYTVTVNTHQPVCEGLTATANIFVKPYPVVNLGADTSVCPNGVPVGLSSKSFLTDPAAIKWLWSTGVTNPIIRVIEPGTYILTADWNGCKTTDEIEVLRDCYTDLPNSFTPNNDGNNDYFYPRQLLSRGVTEFSMTVFNRWGQKIFETKNTDGRGWDGKLNDQDQPVGVYIYKIDATFKDGTVENLTGNVTLLR